MSLHEMIEVCKLDGAQLEGHALLLRSHGERRDRGCRVNLAGVGVRGRIGSRVLVLGGGNRNIHHPLRSLNRTHLWCQIILIYILE